MPKHPIEIERDEHNEALNAKRVSVASAATVYAVVNTGTAGVQNSMATINAGPNYIGLATVDIGTIKAWPNPNTYIGLVTVANTVPVTFSGNVTLSDARTYIGLVTADIGTIKAWANPNTYIGLVTVANTVPVTFSGNVTLDAGSRTAITGNVTLTDAKTFVGLTTIVEGTPFVPGTLVHGMVSAASGALVQFPTNAVKWATVQAAVGNVTTVYVGSSTATINNGYSMGPGDAVGLAINNTNLLYLVGVGTTEARFIGAN